MSDNYLCLPDTQLPFEAEHALKFCIYLKKHFKIPDENILHVGDECDMLHGGNYPKDPDGHYSPTSEIKAAKEKLRAWIKAFPAMRIAISNHGMRWAKKASLAEIPSQMIRAYQDILELPDTWKYQYQWLIKGSKKDFILKHGLDLSGKTPYRTAAEVGTISTVFGHLHSSAGICHVKTNEKNIWAMNVGCLIDVESYAFKYERDHRFKPTLGAGVILNGGTTPIWIPYET